MRCPIFQKRKPCKIIFFLSVGVFSRSSRAGQCAAWGFVTFTVKPVNSCRIIKDRPKSFARPESSRVSVGVVEVDSIVVEGFGTKVAFGMAFLPDLFTPLLVADATEKIDYYLVESHPS